MLQEDLYHFDVQNARKKLKSLRKTGRRDVVLNINEISNSLDNYYLLSKLKLYCAHLSYSVIVHKDVITYDQDNLHFIPEILDTISKKKLHTPIFYVYHKIRILFDDITPGLSDEDTVFINLTHYIQNNKDEFPTEELVHIYSYLTNYCLRRLNKGSHLYYEHCISMYNKMLNEKARDHQLKKEDIPGTVFRNIVAIALQIENNEFFNSLYSKDLNPEDEKEGYQDRFEWVEIFIHRYQNKINKKERTLIVVYCKALLEFSRSNFGKAYRMLSDKADARWGALNMHFKILYLKILYEIFLSNPFALETDNVDIAKTLEAYRGLIRDEQNRKKKLSYQINFYKQFEILYRKLYKLTIKYEGLNIKRNDKAQSEYRSLLDEVEAISFSYKDWFIRHLKNDPANIH